MICELDLRIADEKEFIENVLKKFYTVKNEPSIQWRSFLLEKKSNSLFQYLPTSCCQANTINVTKKTAKYIYEHLWITDSYVIDKKQCITQ